MLAAFLIATALLSTDAWQAPMPRHGALGHLRAGRMARMQVEGAGIEPALNVLGSALESCCSNVRDTGIGTGFYRDGFCSTGMMDEGRHTACVEVSAAFLAFSKDAGNDLSSPAPQYMFPGLKPGDRWCLCASRWAEALKAGVAPKLFLAATHQRTLNHATLEQLMEHALDREEGEATIARLDTLRATIEKAMNQP